MSTLFLPGPIGVEVTDLDLSQPVSQTAVDEWTLLAAERGLVVFRDQRLSTAAQVVFAERFGSLETFPDQSARGNSERRIFRVSNQGDGFHVGHYWHMDGAPRPQPTALSTLLAVEVPTHPSTRTQFLSAAAAYQGLAPAQQQRLQRLHWELASRVSVPMVRAHPLTGQALLTLPFRFPASLPDEALAAHDQIAQLNRDIKPRIAELDIQEQDRLIADLVRHLVSKRQWQIDHVWRAGDLLLWDQRVLYHHAGFSAARRVLHRTGTKGVPPRAYRAGEVQARSDLRPAEPAPVLS